MPNPTREDVDLVLRLYEQRRERVLRRARDWFLSWTPESFEDVRAVMLGAFDSKPNRWFRQATSYWEMVSALMMSGAITPEGRDLFVQSTREFFLVYTKLQPHFPRIRRLSRPTWMKNLERFARSLPDHDTLLAFFQGMLAARAAANLKAETKAKQQAKAVKRPTGRARRPTVPAKR